ncbi:Hpt domain-containing protein [Hymenobacter sp. BT664]|uniref:Hpt domain-containing protein n=1 Tax=Hymenobacter montanus TaxID=2771359 RepID=A0A927BFI1_9BACT|nr:Hpt domain-containing protein [Hymenobacter montanus]MBD2769109.1 Hpt domain-containing protein [Hymenobacter montanus]
MNPQFFIRPSSMHIGQLITATMGPPAPVHYDFSGLGKLAHDAGFVREIQHMFIDRVPGQLVQLETAIEAGDWTSIAHQAHSLKATFGNLCIEPGLGLLKEMEVIAYQHRDKLELRAILLGVAEAAEAVLGIFRQELGRAA